MVAVSISELRKHLLDYIRYIHDTGGEVVVFNEKTGDLLMKMVKPDYQE